MRQSANRPSALTLIELMIVISVVGVLGALLLPAISKAKRSAKRTVCLNHARQISAGVRMYADDMEDLGPSKTSGKKSLDGWTAYKQLLRSYVGQSGASSADDRLFACPSDTYHYGFTPASPTAYDYIAEPIHKQRWSDYSSYGFNGGNTRTNPLTGVPFPGIAGRKLSAIKDPSKTILLAELPAFYCFSWHEPQRPTFPHYFNNAANMAAFVDGHVGYIPFFYDSKQGQNEAWQYDPPAGYDYKWSAD
ncbi:MAG: type II secretion system protein [Verrucomicrobia bacterium]|nr:type II secretion system protein [Verrucomicrobiota bacterium]MBI3868458.1 type II secretion system protein [Verrucomicrobiota bacterium]